MRAKFAGRRPRPVSIDAASLTSAVVASLCLAVLNLADATAQVRSAAAYETLVDSAYQAGGKQTADVYTVDVAVGGVVGVSTAAAPDQVAKHGYIGQLYDLVELQLSANPTTVVERETRQVLALGLYDDGSVGPPVGSSTWYVVSGPLAAVNRFGLAYAGPVDTQTLAVVGLVCEDVTGQLGLLVRNNPELFSNVTARVDATFTNWTFSFLTGTFFGDLELCNATDSQVEMTAPFWYVVASNELLRLMRPDGLHPSNGLPYLDVSAPVIAQLPDGVLYPGQCVSIPDLEFYSAELSVPSGFVWQAWADAYSDGAVADSDGDGMPNSWEMLYSPLLDPYVRDDRRDADGDGMGNRAEWLAGTDPGDPESALRITQARQDSDRGHVITWLSVSNRLYTVYWTTNVASGGFSALAPALPATPPLNTYTDVVERQRRIIFYRVAGRPE